MAGNEEYSRAGHVEGRKHMGSDGNPPFGLEFLQASVCDGECHPGDIPRSYRLDYVDVDTCFSLPFCRDIFDPGLYRVCLCICICIYVCIFHLSPFPIHFSHLNRPQPESNQPNKTRQDKISATISSPLLSSPLLSFTHTNPNNSIPGT